MNKKLVTIAVLGALSSLPGLAMAEEAAVAAAAPAPAAEPASPHTFAYNVGLFSQYIFRGLTQTDRKPALQGGVDYTHASGLYAGAWGSNISWLEDSGLYENSSLELDAYGGYRNTFGESGIGYDVGLLYYYYAGDKTAAGSASTGFTNPDTLEAYAALSWKWLQGKVSYVVTNSAWGTDEADGTYYAELNANIPIAESGFTANLHVGRQEFAGSNEGVDNDNYSYTDWKAGVTKSFSNGVNVGGYYTTANTRDSFWTIDNRNLGDDTFTVFVQKVF
ncbi:MAG TPA: TorF family putative porin [Methylophilaceae bacterium]|nr:TorF family putative porin [Methylophilaceae bacterium]